MSGKGRRITTYIVVLVGMLVFLGFYYQNFIANYFMGMRVVSAEEYIALRESGIPLEVEMPITYWNYEVCYDKEMDSYYVSQNLENPEWEGELQVLYSQMYILQDDFLEDKIEAIKTSHTFQVLAISDWGVSEYKLVFTGMPNIRIDVVEAPDNAEEGENYGKITVFEPGAEKEKVQGCYVTWHPRGNTAKKYAKQSYKVNLYKEDWTPKKISMLGLRKDNDWILNALYTDPSKVREKLAVDIWEIISESNLEVNESGSRMEYVEIFINEEYRGIYGLLEPLDAKQLELDEDDVLYKISSDYYMPTSDELKKNEQNTCYNVEILYPKEMAVSLWNPMSEFVRLFVEGEVWTDESVQDKYYHTKLSNIGDRQIFDQLIFHIDARLKNEYYVVRYNEDDYDLVLVPWDFNLTFGNWWSEDNITNSFYWLEGSMNLLDKGSNSLWRYYEAEFTAEYHDYLEKRWEELQMQGVTEKGIVERAEKHMKYLVESGAFGRDTVKWPECKNSTDLTEIKTYLSLKIPRLTEYLQSSGEWPAN